MNIMKNIHSWMFIVIFNLYDNQDRVHQFSSRPWLPGWLSSDGVTDHRCPEELYWFIIGLTNGLWWMMIGGCIMMYLNVSKNIWLDG